MRVDNFGTVVDESKKHCKYKIRALMDPGIDYDLYATTSDRDEYR